MAPPLGSEPLLQRISCRGSTPTFSPSWFHVSPLAFLRRSSRSGKSLGSDSAPTWHPGSRWHSAYISDVLGREVYKGTWSYGKSRWVITEGGEKVYPQPEDAWIKVLPTLRGWDLLGARARISLPTRLNWAFVMMAGNAFSTRTGSALSFAFAPQTRVPV